MGVECRQTLYHQRPLKTPYHSKVMDRCGIINPCKTFSQSTIAFMLSGFRATLLGFLLWISSMTEKFN